MTRSIKGDSPCAYRVVEDYAGQPTYYGPYSTLGSARAKRTVLKGKLLARDVWIEKTPDGWERIDEEIPQG